MANKIEIVFVHVHFVESSHVRELFWDERNEKTDKNGEFNVMNLWNNDNKRFKLHTCIPKYKHPKSSTHSYPYAGLFHFDRSHWLSLQIDKNMNV